MFLGLETGRHPPLAINATAERNARQAAIQTKRPLVIWTGKYFRMTTLLMTHLSIAVSATVDEYPQETFPVSDQDHGYTSHMTLNKVAWVGHLGRKAYVVPRFTAKNTLLFTLINSLIGIDNSRNTPDPFRRPRHRWLHRCGPFVLPRSHGCCWYDARSDPQYEPSPPSAWPSPGAESQTRNAHH